MHASVRSAPIGVAGAACLLALSMAAPVAAQVASSRNEAETNPGANVGDPQRPSLPPATLTGEWGGLRTRIRDAGIDLTAGYTSETAANISGGERKLVRETGQFAFGAIVDLDRMAGLSGGKVQATVTYRRGRDLTTDAGLDVLQQVQEVYGRGQTWRLTQLWYSQVFADGAADIKLGRLTEGEDFNSFSCDFMNLTFCGAQAGNLVGDYWYNWPISQWGARLRVKRGGALYAMAGVYETNPRNLDKDFTIGRFRGATGVLLPVELGWTPRFGAARLPGSYKIGGWYETSDGDDLLLDRDRRLRPLTGAPALRRDGRHGYYMNFQQQLTGAAEDDPVLGAKTTRGLTAFLNITQADRATSRTDNQISGGAFYVGPFRARPMDDIAIAVGRTNYNGRAARADLLADPGAGRRRAGYAIETYYSYRPTPWLILRPNIQLLIHPGGFRDATDIVVLGLKGAVTF